MVRLRESGVLSGSRGETGLSGPIYVFVLSDEGFVLFHGGDPFLEGRTVLDLADVNGVKIFRELLGRREAGRRLCRVSLGRPIGKGGRGHRLAQVELQRVFPLAWQEPVFHCRRGHLSGSKINRSRMRAERPGGASGESEPARGGGARKVVRSDLRRRPSFSKARFTCRPSSPHRGFELRVALAHDLFHDRRLHARSL